MTFIQSIKSVFKKYFLLRGRARRSEFWWFYLLYMIVMAVFGASVYIVFMYGGTVATVTMIISMLALFALIMPYLAVATRRLHDTGRSGWWLLAPTLISLASRIIPMASIIFTVIGYILDIVMIVLYAQDSQYGDNQYGPNPKDPAPAIDPNNLEFNEEEKKTVWERYQ